MRGSLLTYPQVFVLFFEPDVIINTAGNLSSHALIVLVGYFKANCIVMFVLGMPYLLPSACFTGCFLVLLHMSTLRKVLGHLIPMMFFGHMFTKTGLISWMLMFLYSFQIHFWVLAVFRSIFEYWLTYWFLIFWAWCLFINTPLSNTGLDIVKSCLAFFFSLHVFACVPC